MLRIAKLQTFLSMVLSGIGLFQLLAYTVRIVPELTLGGLALLSITLIISGWFYLWDGLQVWVILYLIVLSVGVILAWLN